MQSTTGVAQFITPDCSRPYDVYTLFTIYIVRRAQMNFVLSPCWETYVEEDQMDSGYFDECDKAYTHIWPPIVECKICCLFFSHPSRTQDIILMQRVNVWNNICSIMDGCKLMLTLLLYKKMSYTGCPLNYLEWCRRGTITND